MLSGFVRISSTSSRSFRRRFKSRRLFRAIFGLRRKSIGPPGPVVLIFEFKIHGLEQAAKRYRLVTHCEEGRRNFLLPKTISADRPTLRENRLVPLQAIEAIE